MQDLKDQIVSSYTQEKLSEIQISEKFSIPPKDVRRILNQNNIERRSRSEAIRYHHITKFGQKEFTPKAELTREEELLKVAGVMLYWGEGTKNRGTVALANSDPKLIKIFVNFLRTICGIDESRVHITLHYYEDQNEEELITFWMQTMQISREQFYKSFLHIKTSKGSYRNPSKYGTVSIQYSDKKLLLLIREWMTEYEELGVFRTNF